jgi:tetratricopeptide (TPR) repeat protein/class 3 adenylate cyclase
MSQAAATEEPGTPLGSMMLRRTVAVVDMVGYSSIARMLEENISAMSVSDLNRQIQGLFSRALGTLQDRNGYCVVSKPGDGIILLFERADDAHQFGRQVHLFSKEHNELRSERTAQRWFRVGVATGDVDATACSTLSADYAGLAIINAVRLESAARTGDILVDTATYSLFSPEVQRLYGAEETVEGKREERFRVRRFHVVDAGAGEAKRPLRPLLTRRAVLTTGTAAAIVTGFSAWRESSWVQSWVENRMHPLPAKRFVALLAWPDPAPELAPMLRSVLSAIHTRLSRAEMSDHDLLVVGPDEMSDPALSATPDADHPDANRAAVSPKTNPKQITGTWNANLILAAHLVSQLAATPGILELQVLDAAATTILRRRRVKVDADKGGDVNQLAARFAARLLDLPEQEVEMSDEAELASVTPAARNLFEQGKLLTDLNATRLDDALMKYEEALALNPTFALAYAEVGLLYVRRFHKWNEAAALPLAGSNLDTALRLNPHSETAHLGEARYQLALGHPDLALAQLDTILKPDPMNSDALLYKAQAYDQQKNPVGAEEIYKQLTVTRPNYWKAWNDLGQKVSERGDAKAAIPYFEKATLAAPGIALPFVNLGTVYYQAGRKEDARVALERSLAIARNATALSTLGTMAFEDKDYRTALSEYLEASRLEPKNYLTLSNLGDCYEMLGDRTGMMKCYARAADILAGILAVSPLDGFGWMSLGLYRAKIGQREQAQIAVRKAESQGTPTVEMVFTKARVLALLGDIPEATKLVLYCLDHQWSRTDVELATELSPVRASAEYKAYFAAQDAPGKS